jgi:SAM-dependent methyltransferase
MTFADHFSGHAALYRRARPTYPQRLIADLAELSPGRRQAWDAGTGNGQSARMLADHFDAVFATDASIGQIVEAAPHPRVRFAAERAEQCSLPDASCDLVVAAQCIHWFDHPRFFAEARRVLRPNGLLAAIGYDWLYVDDRVDEIVGRTILKPLEPLWAAENWLLVDGYRTIDFPGEEVRLSPAAIHMDWTREQVENYVRSWSAVQRLGEEIVQAGFAELAREWPDSQSRHVVMPILSRASRL